MIQLKFVHPAKVHLESCPEYWVKWGEIQKHTHREYHQTDNDCEEDGVDEYCGLGWPLKQHCVDGHQQGAPTCYDVVQTCDADCTEVLLRNIPCLVNHDKQCQQEHQGEPVEEEVPQKELAPHSARCVKCNLDITDSVA